MRILVSLMLLTTAAYAHGDGVRRALAHLAAGRGVDAAGLRVARVHSFPRGSLVRFRQMHGGLEVVGASAAVRLDAAGRVLWARSSLAGVLALGTTPEVSAAEASERVLGGPAAHQGRASLPSADQVRLVVYAPPNRAPRLAWMVVLPHHPRFVETLRAFVDARSGAILAVDNLVRRSGRAWVYPENPIATPELAEITLLGLPAEAQQLDGIDIAVRSCLDRKTCSKEADKWVHACEPDATATADGAGNFFYDRPPSDKDPADTFAEVQAYYHVMRAYAAFRDLSGDPAFSLRQQPMQVVVNYRVPDLNQEAHLCSGPADPDAPELLPFDQAYFTIAGTVGVASPQPMIIIGQGTDYDLAYDGDILYHELTHAVAREVSDIGWAMVDPYGVDISQWSMEEGYADYFSSTITDDPHMGEYGGRAFLDGVRALDNDLTCPASHIGEPHVDSMAWSAALWEIRRQLPASHRAAMDAAVFRGLAALGASDTFTTAPELTVAELEAELGDEAGALAAQVFAGRGFSDGCRHRVIDIGLGDEKNEIALYGVDRFYDLPLVPSPMQFKIDLPEDATAVAVEIKERYLLPDAAGNAARGQADVKLLVKPGDEPLQWSWSDEALGVHDAPYSADVSFVGKFPGTGKVTGSFPAGTYHVQLANAGVGRALVGVRFLSTPARVPATPPDGGVGDASPDGSAALPLDDPHGRHGCHAASSAGLPGMLALWALLGAIGLHRATGRRPRQ